MKRSRFVPKAVVLGTLVVASAGTAFAQREGGAFWGPFSHGSSMGAGQVVPRCYSGWIMHDARCSAQPANRNRRVRGSRPK
jgi:hypothetical protein